MPLKKLALPGEDKEDTLTSSGIPAALLEGENVNFLSFWRAGFPGYELV